MSWCSEWIRNWLRCGPRTQTELARLAGVDSANVSRWLSGQSRPDAEVVARMAKNLAETDAASLAEAWAKDLVPPALAPYLEIRGKSGPAKIPPPGLSGFGELGQDLLEKLELFGRLAVANPDLRRIIDVVYEAAMGAEKGAAGKKKGRK